MCKIRFFKRKKKQDQYRAPKDQMPLVNSIGEHSSFFIQKSINLKVRFILYTFMPRTKDQIKNCQHHLFQISPLFSSCYYNQTIKVQFCVNNNKVATKQPRKCYQGPAFNTDKNCSSPAFVLKSQSSKYKQTAPAKNDQSIQIQNKNCESKSQLLFPKPNSKSSFCNVCREKYEDYKTHIESERHAVRIKSNIFNKHILNLVSFYQKDSLDHKKNKKQSCQSTNSENQCLIVLDGDSQQDREVMSKPKKKVKMDHSINQNMTYSFGLYPAPASYFPQLNMTQYPCYTYQPYQPFMPSIQYPFYPPMSMMPHPQAWGCSNGCSNMNNCSNMKSARCEKTVESTNRDALIKKKGRISKEKNSQCIVIEDDV